MTPKDRECTCPDSQWVGSEPNDSTCELSEEEHLAKDREHRIDTGSPELLPCPFCGADGQIEVLGGPGSSHRVVKCSKCKCDMHFYSTPEMAVAKWNERASHRQVATAFDLIAKANTVTICSLGEMESIVIRALEGEFDK